MRATRAQTDALAELLAERPLQIDGRLRIDVRAGGPAPAGTLRVRVGDAWAVEHYWIDRAGLVTAPQLGGPPAT